MTSDELATYIAAVLNDDLGSDLNIKRVHTFEEAGMMSSDAGIVVTTYDGDEYQMRVVKSR